MSDEEYTHDGPTPWVMCPECGGIWVRVLAVIERGRWSEDGERYEIAVADLPRVGAFIGGDNGEALECRDCGTKFDLPRDGGAA